LLTNKRQGREYEILTGDGEFVFANRVAGLFLHRFPYGNNY